MGCTSTCPPRRLASTRTPIASPGDECPGSPRDPVAAVRMEIASSRCITALAHTAVSLPRDNTDMASRTHERVYAHHMLREIYEQPQALAATLDHYVHGSALNEQSFAPVYQWFRDHHQ